jgi:hypothetical protein
MDWMQEEPMNNATPKGTKSNGSQEYRVHMYAGNLVASRLGNTRPFIKHQDMASFFFFVRFFVRVFETVRYRSCCSNRKAHLNCAVARLLTRRLSAVQSAAFPGYLILPTLLSLSGFPQIFRPQRYWRKCGEVASWAGVHERTSYIVLRILVSQLSLSNTWLGTI